MINQLIKEIDTYKQMYLQNKIDSTVFLTNHQRLNNQINKLKTKL